MGDREGTGGYVPESGDGQNWQSSISLFRNREVRGVSVKGRSGDKNRTTLETLQYFIMNN